MKKGISMMLMVMLLLCSVPTTAFATLATGKVPTEYSFFISIYKDTDHTYPVENTMITVDYNLTLLQTLDVLKDEGLVVDYWLDGNALNAVKLKEQTLQTFASASETLIFYTKINGQKQDLDSVDRLIENGDIIEWIYGTLPEEVYIPPETGGAEHAQTKPQTKAWTELAQEAINDGCEFLTLNQETSDFYIVAMGSAGKTADVKMVNGLLSDIRQIKTDDSPTAIAKNILSLTFCGYAASELVETLSNYPDIGKQGIFGAINSLVAYDSKQYSVPSTQVNAREKLIAAIVASQRETGGFGINQAAKDDLDTTAMAITALSPYRKRNDIQKVIDQAVAFLVKNQTPTGGFGFMGQESSESLSQVIIALSSIGVEVNDSRFVNQKKNLLDQLLEYRNDDGGFAHIKGDTSISMATEQAVIALCSIKQNDNPYKMTRGVLPLPEPKTDVNLVEVVKQHPLRTFGIVMLVVFILLTIAAAMIVKTKTKKEQKEQKEQSQ